MRREALARLQRWLGKANRKPLVLRGARQVGKTWLVTELTKLTSLELIELNFEFDPELADHFISSDPLVIIKSLEVHYGRKLDPQKILLFLDEIQVKPDLLAKLRWFKEKMPELAVIAAGSLLEFVLTDHQFSMPVGRISYMHIEPLSFLEYVSASGNIPLYEALKSSPLLPRRRCQHVHQCH